MATNNYEQYPKIHIAVDCVILTYDDNQLKLLLYPRNIEPQLGNWSLMGGFVDGNETLEDAARRVLKQTVGLNNIFLEQVQGFSAPNREPNDRVISIAFYAMIANNSYNRQLVDEHKGKWWPLAELPNLIFDHKEMVDRALIKLQHKASHELIGKNMLPEYFTLTLLNNLYNAIFQRTFDAGNFRKKIATLGILQRTQQKDNSTSKKGAYIYKYRDDIENDLPLNRIVKI